MNRLARAVALGLPLGGLALLASMSLDLSSYKQTTGQTSDANKLDNGYDAIQNFVNALPIANLAGYPADAAKFLRGDGAWAGSYSSYTPAWTSTGAAPAIGNSTVNGRYTQIGKMVHAWGLISFGNTATFGTGVYIFSLPVPVAVNVNRMLGMVDMFDSSTSNRGSAWAEVQTSSTVTFAFPGAYLGGSVSVGQTNPWTWAVSDFLAWNLTYEAA